MIIGRDGREYDPFLLSIFIPDLVPRLLRIVVAKVPVRVCLAKNPKIYIELYEGGATRTYHVYDKGAYLFRTSLVANLSVSIPQ